MNTTEVVGFCALCLGAIQGIPQYHKIHVHNDMSSFSMTSIIIGLFASIFSLFYGYLKKAPPIMIGSFGGIIASIYLIIKMKQCENKNNLDTE
jgi:uncharacterized protein with PQ loop repeat